MNNLKVKFKEEEKFEFAKYMLEQNISKVIISNCTYLSVEEIDEIKKKL